MSGLEPSDVIVYLRRHGVTVHHAATVLRDPSDSQTTVVVFLEAARHQHEQAEALARELPGVTGVEFSGGSQTVMYVIGAP